MDKRSMTQQEARTKLIENIYRSSIKTIPRNKSALPQLQQDTQEQLLEAYIIELLK